MVVLPREPLVLTLCGYPESVVPRTRYSSTSYPTTWLGSDLSARVDLAEPEIELEAGDALVLDGTNTEGLGGLGGGHIIYRFEKCDINEAAVLWTNPSFSPGSKPEHEHSVLLDFVAARGGPL